MAKKAMVLKQQRTPKYSTRAYNRCKICPEDARKKRNDLR